MISVKSNIKELTKSINGFRDQIPFAVSVALNKTAYDAAQDTKQQMQRDLDKPTPWTLRGTRYNKSNKRNLIASVEIDPTRWDYLQFAVMGGRRLPKNTAIAIGAGTKRNKYGNVPRGTIKRLLARPDTFKATIHGVSGIWQRTKYKTLKLLFTYKSEVIYQGKQFHYVEGVNKTVSRVFNGHLAGSLRQAIRTAKLT